MKHPPLHKCSPTASALSLRLGGLTAALFAAAMIMVFAIVGCGGDNSSSAPPHKATPSPTPTPAINAALWVATGSFVLEYTPSQLAVQGVSTPVPVRSISGHGIGAPNGLAFDAAGDLWVAMGAGGGPPGAIPPSLTEFTPAQLPTEPNNDPVQRYSTVINFTGFTVPAQVVFDTKGDLWLSDSGSNAVFEYTATQLAMASNQVVSVTPNIVLTSNPAFTGPVGIAFDAAGDLWIANNGATTIFEFNAASLPAAAGSTITLTPDVVLSDDGNGSIQAPWGLVFDTAGNLWSSNSALPFTLVEFAKTVLASSGNPIPAVTISPTQVAGLPSLNSPSGIAFDNLGGLAAANLGENAISLFSNTQIGASGAPVPDVFFAQQFSSAGNVVFGPAY